MDRSEPARLLCCSGIDPTGGAGLALDVRVAAGLGVRAAAVPTCLTVQNRRGFVRAEAVVPSTLAAMLGAVGLGAVGDEGGFTAVKLGMFADVESIEVVATWLAARTPRPWLVVDPVLSATAGGGPANATAIARAIVERLMPLGAVVTPNLPELAALGGGAGAVVLLSAGAHAVLVKGGHGDGEQVVDVLHDSAGTREFTHLRCVRGPVHGTGCALASSIAARLARGESLADAVAASIDAVAQWIARTPDPGDGLPAAIVVG